jgi:hypothetical protein
MRTLRSALLLTCALLPFALATSATAAPDPAAGLVAAPAPGSSTEPAGSYFVVAAAPGQTVTQSVALHNNSDQPMELRLAGVDATTAQQGGSAFALDTEPQVKAGGWLTLDRASVMLGAKASLTVPFRITVPAGATSGVHLAGIAMMLPTPTTDADAVTGKAGASVSVQTRRVIAVQINLPGPAEPELVITGVTPVARPSGLYLELGVENRGGGLTKGEGDVTLAADGFAQKFNIATFVPGTSIAYPIKWTDKAVDGDHHAHVEIRYGDRMAVWDGKFTVGEAIKKEQTNRQVVPPSDSPTSSPKNGLPVGFIAGGILGAVFLLGGGILLGRRSNDDNTPAPVAQTVPR